MNNMEIQLRVELDELKIKYSESLSKNIELQKEIIDLIKQIGRYEQWEINPMQKQ